jgi:anti-sigma B factor antagonist
MNETSPPDPGPVSSDPAEFLHTEISRPRPGTAVLTVRGEIDTLTAPAFTAAAKELVSGLDERLVVDMTGVTFLASSGLAVLIQTAHRAEDRGLRLRLVVATRAVRRPLEITATDRLFQLYSDLDAATTAD